MNVIGDKAIFDAELLPLVLIPVLSPIAAAIMAYLVQVSSQGARARVLGRLLLAGMAYTGSVYVSSRAYHVGNAYASLFESPHPQLIAVGLGWALLMTLPSVIAAFSRYSSLSIAFGVGCLLGAIALLLLLPVHMGMLLLLSLE